MGLTNRSDAPFPAAGAGVVAAVCCDLSVPLAGAGVDAGVDGGVDALCPVGGVGDVTVLCTPGTPSNELSMGGGTLAVALPPPNISSFVFNIFQWF